VVRAMEEQQIEDLFSFYGYSDLYKRFQVPLYVTGLLDNVETEVLEDFLEKFSFDYPVLFDEFRFWFKYFLVSKGSPYNH
jgi:hypothetical protein